MRNLILLLLVGTAFYIGFQKLVRKPDIKAGNLSEVLVYGDYSNELKATFKVEIADDPFERQKGLMYRENLPKDRGMLFIFKRGGRYPMWMKNTPIPLDMIFISSNHRIVEIVENTRPKTEKSYGGNKRHSYVLEVNAGDVKKYGIKVDNVVKGLSERGN